LTAICFVIGAFVIRTLIRVSSFEFARLDIQPMLLDPSILARIVPLGLRANHVVEGSISGLHRSPMHGLSPEFADHREYAPGDDLKRLDWRAYARSNKFQIKRYEEESNLRATILLDASASMKYGRGAMSKWTYAATLAASLAALCVRQRDAAGLALFDDDQRVWIRPAATRAQLAKVINALEKAGPERQTELGTVLAKLADQIRSRGVVVIISDLLTNLDSFYTALGRLQHQGHEILIFQILDSDEIDLPFEDSVLFRDIEPGGAAGGKAEELFAEPWAFRRQYKAAMEAFIADVAHRCRFGGIDHLLMRTSDDLGTALSHYLHKRHTGGPRRAGKVTGGPSNEGGR
jgi:uncharacterized protein (DUF58 family)